MLTNAHIAAPIGTTQKGEDVLQPAPADGGTSEDEIGTVAEFSEIAKNEPNTTDSALVAVDPTRIKDTILGVGEFAGFTEPTKDATYTKSGRTTGVTTGKLRAQDARIRIGGYYDEPTVFTGVDVFGPMSAGGDSGSLIGITDNGFRGTHLLFAGSDRSTIGIPFAAIETEHGELTSHEDTGSGDGNGSVRSFRDAVRSRLKAAYGADAVREGDDVDFRVAGPVPMAVALAAEVSVAPDAAGKALAAAESGTVSVLAYPEALENPTITRLGNHLALLPVQT